MRKEVKTAWGIVHFEREPDFDEIKTGNHVLDIINYDRAFMRGLKPVYPAGVKPVKEEETPR
ncbi:hypothetical protein HY405_00190 [Candidatus Microgenomates bacterium]|nr:hypothetical protein [Candidatus Microgenomates bacterium]